MPTPSNVGEMYDVIQIGYGPVGQTLASLLGQRGWNIAVFERHKRLYGLPRAGHFDHEIARIFQGIGAVDAFIDKAVAIEAYTWFNRDRQKLLSFETEGTAISGWHSGYMFYQPYVEAALDSAVAKHNNVAVNFGWQAVALRQHKDFVEVTLTRYEKDGAHGSEPETRTVRTRYVVAADGANSATRQSLGIQLEDLGFQEQWLVVDVRLKTPLDVNAAEIRKNGSYQICDPARPMMSTMLSAEHKRFGFMRMPTDSDGHLEDPETVWSLIRPWVTPDTADMIRSVVYQFRSTLACEWRKDRVLLAGDAVHLMPPFLGQGMCSGIRDVANLAWKLDLVLAAKVDDAILDSYQIERSPHVRAHIARSVHVGKISCTADTAQAAARDAALLAGEMPPPPAPLVLEQGLLQSGRNSSDPIGSLGPQARIRLGQRTSLADNILGHGRWQLLCRKDPRSSLSMTTQNIIDDLNIACVWFGDGGAEDLEGVYKNWFNRYDIEAALVRPDFYVYGVAKTLSDIDALFIELRTSAAWIASAQRAPSRRRTGVL